MLYYKPKDIKYTDMAIYIDQYLTQKDVPEDVQCTIFEYLYHLIVMLARKGRFFNKSEYYDDFAITLATDVYFRLFSPKRFEFDANGKAKLAPIKSSLNYLKSIINFRKINFEQENFAQVFSVQEEETEFATGGYTFSDQISDSINDLNTVEFKCCLETIDSGIREYLKRIPYKNKSSEWYNIYLSVLLTFIYSITLSKSDIKRLKCSHTPSYMAELYNQLLLEETKKPVAILYHLDNSMWNYIILLVREVKHFLADELATMTDTNISARDLSFLAVSDINSNQSNYDYYSDNNGEYYN